MENEGFKNMIKTICPLYKLPSRNTIERRIDDIYDVIAGDFRKTLSTVQYVAVTTDAWTETMQMKSFLSITLHIIVEAHLESSNVFYLYFIYIQVLNKIFI